MPAPEKKFNLKSPALVGLKVKKIRKMFISKFIAKVYPEPCQASKIKCLEIIVWRILFKNFI